MVLESEEDELGVEAEMLLELGPATSQGRWNWSLSLLERRGAELDFPPYLQEQSTVVQFGPSGIEKGQNPVPCFLMPRFPPDPLQAGWEWTVEDRSSGDVVVHTFQVIESEPQDLVAVSYAELDKNGSTAEIAGQYVFSREAGVLEQARIVIDSETAEWRRSLAIELNLLGDE